MKEWKIRQKLFHSLTGDRGYTDDLSTAKLIEEWDPKLIVRRALEYPSCQRDELHYPGKSYAVAITFAKLLEIHFGESFHELLDDPMLLYGNDPYFRTWSEAREVYEAILQDFPWALIERPDLASPDFQKTVEYFYREFLLHSETKHLAPASS